MSDEPPREIEASIEDTAEPDVMTFDPERCELVE
jgi:hypothetical protein